MRNYKAFLLYKWQELVRDGLTDQRKLLGGKASVIFDVGAYIGRIANKYQQMFPDAIIYCFEPYPDTFRKLQRIENKRTLVYNLAVSDRERVMDLQVNRNYATNSLLFSSEEIAKWADKPTDVMPMDTIKVKVTTVDKFCRENKIGHIDILKMDIQGGEIMALHGAQRMLSTQQIDLIYIELLFVPLYDGQASFEAISNYLAVSGYKLFNFYNFAIDKTGRLKWCDGLFCLGKILNGK